MQTFPRDWYHNLPRQRRRARARPGNGPHESPRKNLSPSPSRLVAAETTSWPCSSDALAGDAGSHKLTNQRRGGIESKRLGRRSSQKLSSNHADKLAARVVIRSFPWLTTLQPFDRARDGENSTTRSSWEVIELAKVFLRQAALSMLGAL
jgi:hypothetical protein